MAECTDLQAEDKRGFVLCELPIPEPWWVDALALLVTAAFLGMDPWRLMVLTASTSVLVAATEDRRGR